VIEMFQLIKVWYWAMCIYLWISMGYEDAVADRSANSREYECQFRRII